jgi:hypothetical protein
LALSLGFRIIIALTQANKSICFCLDMSPETMHKITGLDVKMAGLSSLIYRAKHWDTPQQVAEKMGLRPEDVLTVAFQVLFNHCLHFHFRCLHFHSCMMPRRERPYCGLSGALQSLSGFPLSLSAFPLSLSAFPLSLSAFPLAHDAAPRTSSLWPFRCSSIIFFPTPAVADSSVYFYKLQSNPYHKTKSNITSQFFTIRLQYCAWGTPSALSYYGIQHCYGKYDIHDIIIHTNTVRFRVHWFRTTFSRRFIKTVRFLLSV